MDSKDKRISFLSLFSSISQNEKDPSKVEDLAYAFNKRLYEVYPITEEEVKETKIMEKSKPTKCPKCGRLSLYNNKGISKKSGAPYENVKCSNKSCGYIEWKTMNYAQHREQETIKSMHNDSDYESNQQETYGEHYDNTKYGY